MKKKYDRSENCINRHTDECCQQCGKCGRRFRNGIIVDETGSEWHKHIDGTLREEYRHGWQ